MPCSGGRTWWARFEFTRINIEPIILKNKIEESEEVDASPIRIPIDNLEERCMLLI